MNSVLLVCSVSVVLVLVNSLRIPENPCPEIFHYYRRGNGEVYGEVDVPYDGKTKLVLTVNASMVGYFEKGDLKIQLVTPNNQVPTASKLTYSVFFPFRSVVPKVTQIIYNGQIFCSGPPEPIIPGTPGITNVWAKHIYSFSNFASPEIIQTPNSNTPDISEFDIPIKEPTYTKPEPTYTKPEPTYTKPEPSYPKPDTLNINLEPRPSLNLNPFVDPEMDTRTLPPSSFSPNDVDNECGVSGNYISSRILGGNETEEGQFPWLVAMLVYIERTQKYDYRCTANLVSEKHVITAARCVQYGAIRTVETQQILFVFGKTDISNWKSSGAVTRRAVNVQSHPSSQQNPTSAHGDIAVITLDKPVQFSSSIRSVCLWNDTTELDPLVHQMGTLAAWGLNKKTESVSPLSFIHAKFVRIPVVSQFDCLKSDLAFQKTTSDMTFCAGDQNGNGPCIGDSGAGFTFPKNNKYYLRGIASLVSSANGHCDLRKYAVFCDVAKFQSWILSCMES